MADALANIACCFDASKDLGETSVELVICNCPATKKCCIKWETFTFVAALVFSSVDFIADVFGYKSFVDTVSDKQEIQVYINIWFVLIITSGVIILSEISLPLYSLIKIAGCCTNKSVTDEEIIKCREKTKYWSRANNISVVLTEDGVVALIKVLIAFQSVDAVQDLQETAGVVNSCIAFAVTFLRHCLLMIQIITKLSRNNVLFSKCPAWESGYCVKATLGIYCLFFLTLFLSCCSIGLTGMSMAISLKLIDIYHDDIEDFMLNITLLSVIVPCIMILSVFIIIQTRW